MIAFSFVSIYMICQSPPSSSKLPNLIEKMRVDMKLPGLQVCAVKNGKVLVNQGFGESDIESHEKVDSKTRFWIGSVTKTFTSGLVLKLVQDGKLNLNDPLIQDFPGAPKKWSQITIRQLLSHTSGIPNYTEYLPTLLGMSKPLQRARVYKTLSQLPLENQPGDKYSYSNTNYLLLGDVIENKYHESFVKALKDHILKPYELDSIGIIEKPSPNKDIAQGYQSSSGKLSHANLIDPSFPFSAGDLQSTAQDLTKWSEVIESSKFLSKETLNLAFTPGTVKSGVSNYGLGWVLGSIKMYPTVGHTGGINGFRCTFLRLPTLKFVVAVCANLESADTDQIALAVAKQLNPELSNTPIADTDQPLTQRTKNFLKDFLDGKPETSAMTDELAKVLTSAFGKQLGTQFSSKSIDSMQLIQRTGNISIYTSDSLGKSFNVVVVVDGSGKFAGLRFQPAG